MKEYLKKECMDKEADVMESKISSENIEQNLTEIDKFGSPFNDVREREKQRKKIIIVGKKKEVSLKEGRVLGNF